MYLKYLEDEQRQIQAFRGSCNQKALEVKLSQRALTALHKVAQRKGKAPLELSEPVVYPLARRGLIKQDDENYWRCTELGYHVLALAEAAALLPEDDE